MVRDRNSGVKSKVTSWIDIWKGKELKCKMNCDVLNYSKRWVNICFFCVEKKKRGKKNRGKPAAQYIPSIQPRIHICGVEGICQCLFIF